ncbi:MAG: hypothetical protein ABR526_11290 [Chthoniobacterales bacterium]
MLSRCRAILALILSLHLAGRVSAQQAIAPHASFEPGFAAGVTADGMALAQTDAAIERARLRQEVTAPTSIGVDANGVATADTETVASDDDSFGAQMILKNQERQPTFVVTGSASVVYTDNVALTRRGTHDDLFAIADASITWMPRLGHNIETSIGPHVSVFRYDKTSELDFQNVGFGAGLAWSPQQWQGVGVFGRYDLTELFGRDGHQILLDNVLTLGAQKSFVFGRSHALTVGVTAAFGFSDPAPAQRDQLGAFLAYHLQLTRKLDTDFLYRPAVHFYNDSGRVDFNQILSWSLRYRLTNWAELSTSLSYGVNRSDKSVFDYDVITTGATASVSVRF